MKVLIIDPWCSDNYEVYTIGLCEGLCDKVDLTICSSYYESRYTEKYNIKPIFFKISDKMCRGMLRSAIRGIEYAVAYIKILIIVRREKYDVVHVEWALLYRMDEFFLKQIRKYVKRLVYTSHNVLPHINGEKYVTKLKRLHNNFDVILVHGEGIKKEYLKYFPEDKNKLKIQYHGIHLTQKKEYVISKVDKHIVDFISSAKKKIISFVGNIFYNKGADRVINYWVNNLNDTEQKLVVAGSLNVPYSELEQYMQTISNSGNILFVPRFLNDDEYAYVLANSSAVVIPYRHASMSGIVYSAAAFRKPVIYTNTGSIAEYMGDECGIQATNTDESLFQALDKSINMDEATLQKLGSNLNKWIYNNYSWNIISAKLVNEVYALGN